MHATGSISGPHIAPCSVNNWATFSLIAFLHFLLSAGRMRFLKNHASKKQIKQKSRVNNWSTCASKNSSQNVNPSRQKTVIKIGRNSYFYCGFRQTHLQTSENQKQKHDNFKSWKHNCPFDFDRKSFYFLRHPCLFFHPSL